MDDDSRVRQLRWRCRRGMKELDILLERFLVSQSQAIERGQWPALEGLLETEDDVLWAWIQNPALVSDGAHRALLAEIRKLRVRAN